MVSAKALRNEILHRLAEKLNLRVTKKFRRARVGATNHPLGVCDKNRVWRDIEQILQRRVSELSPFEAGPSRRFPIWGIRWEHAPVTWLQYRSVHTRHAGSKRQRIHYS